MLLLPQHKLSDIAGTMQVTTTDMNRTLYCLYWHTHHCQLRLHYYGYPCASAVRIKISSVGLLFNHKESAYSVLSVYVKIPSSSWCLLQHAIITQVLQHAVIITVYVTAHCWYHSVCYSMLLISQCILQHAVDITVYFTARCWYHSVCYSILLISQCTIQHTITITVYITTYCCYHSVCYQTCVYLVSDQSEWIIPTCLCSRLLLAASCGPSLPDLSISFQLCCLAVNVETALWGPCQWRMLLNIVWGLLSVDPSACSFLVVAKCFLWSFNPLEFVHVCMDEKRYSMLGKVQCYEQTPWP